ncbi:yneE [Ketogulonicigenium robustum]|uniref:YneE n=1 Tax=Ketogulonicigenium robustum TaxID=92947 RepID=A0A1W6P1U9_9RHOB|nr:bestrophin family protein [Ketogulonicigenium robustum]ARO15492.1 yneE [Ketogulonicigenium robustum]
MIVRKRPNAFLLLFLLRGGVIQRIWVQLVMIGLMSLAIVTAHHFFPDVVRGVNPAPFALIGIALSVFLSFRNTASYDRWWEGRKLWGLMIQTSNDFARQSVVLDRDGVLNPARQALLTQVIAFAAATVRVLRPGEKKNIGDTPLARLSPPEAILTEMTAQLGQLLRDRQIEPSESYALNRHVATLCAAQISCERLANTPLPFAYTLLLHRTAYLFCFMLPFGFADFLGWGTPLAVMLMAYTFFGLDALGAELEEPFGLMPNNLPIAAYARAVEINMRAAMGETDLPEPIRPDRYVLI